MAMPEQAAPKAPIPLATLRARGFKSPFGAFGDAVFCPHCGSHYPRSEVEVVATGDAGGAPCLAVSCPRCHAHGILRGPTEEAA